jgi:DNA polymerase
MLDKLMAAAGISSSQVRLFNVVPYRPLTKSKSGAIRNRTPTRREIREYSMILFEDIRKTAPRAILASGKVAMAAFGIQLPLREVRKSVFRFEGTPVFVTYHPRYVTYSGGEGSPVWKQVVMDLRTSWERSG